MNNLIYGYARVSSKEQNEDRQLKVIKDYCIKNDLQLEDRNILIDKRSGKDFKRPSYQTLKTQLLRKGDILIVKELDRLGRNKQQISGEYSGANCTTSPV